MKKRSGGSFELPPQSETNQRELQLTDCEIEALRSEREKSYLYRMALIDNSLDLLPLLLLTRDKKMIDFINSALEGALGSGSALFIGAAALGITVNAPVILAALFGGALINYAVRD